MDEKRRYEDKNGLVYLYDEKGAMIEKYIGNALVLSLPISIEIEGITYPILGIKSNAFIHPSLKALMIPHGYQYMEHWAIFLDLDEHLHVYIDDQYDYFRAEWNEYWTNASIGFYYLRNDNQKLWIQDDAYYVYQDQEAILTLYLGKEKDFKIPSFIEVENKKYPVSKIASYAFLNCSSLTKISTPKSINEVAYGAFKNCSSLKEVTFLNDDTSLGQLVFDHCSKLKKITLPKNLKSIPSTLLGDCSSLEKIMLPSEIEIIHDFAFASCFSLKWIIIPSKVDYIENYAFYDLKDITIYVDRKEEDTKGYDMNWNEAYNNIKIPTYYRDSWEIVDGIPRKKI